MNSVSLIGRLTRDPDVRYTSESQLAVARFSIAINSGYGDKERTDYPNIVVFGKQAENCEKYLSKGRQVGIHGRLQTGSYQNKEGKTVYTTDVIADRVEFLGGRDGQGGGSGSNYRASSNQENQAPTEEMPESFQAIDEDVPF